MVNDLIKKEPIYSEKNWTAYDRELVTNTREVDSFLLSTFPGSEKKFNGILNDKVFITNFGDTYIELALDLIGKISFFRKKNGILKIILQIIFWIKYFSSIFKLDYNHRGIIIGEKHKEYGIRENQKVFIFGEFLYDKLRKSFRGTIKK